MHVLQTAKNRFIHVRRLMPGFGYTILSSFDPLFYMQETFLVNAPVGWVIAATVCATMPKQLFSQHLKALRVVYTSP